MSQQRRSGLNEQMATALVAENYQRGKSVRLTSQESKVLAELNRNRIRAFAVMTRSRGVMLGFSSHLGVFNTLINSFAKGLFTVKNKIVDSVKGIRDSFKRIEPKKLTIRAKGMLESRLQQPSPSARFAAKYPLLTGLRTPGLSEAMQEQFRQQRLAPFKGLRPMQEERGAQLLSGMKEQQLQMMLFGKSVSDTPFTKIPTKAFPADMMRGMEETRAYIASQVPPKTSSAQFGEALKGTGRIGVPPTPFATTTAMGPPPKETSKFFNDFNKSEKASKSMGKNVMKPLLGMLAQGALSIVSMGAMMVFTQLLNGIMTVFQPVIQIINMFITQVAMGFMPLIQALITEFTKPEFLESVADIAESVRIAAIEMVESGFVEEIAKLLLEILKGLPDFTDFVVEVTKLAVELIPLVPLMTDLVTALKDLFAIVSDIVGAIPEGLGAVGSSGDIGNFFADLGVSILSMFGLGGLIGAASGAVVEPPGGLFNVGEGGQTELITPVPMLRQIIREETGGNAGGRGGQTITINLTLNGIAPGSDLNELSQIIARKIGFALQ